MLDSASRMPGPWLRIAAMPSAITGITAGGRPAIAHDRAQRRRLAGAVASDQAHELTLADLERDVAQDAARLDVDAQPLDGQHHERGLPSTVATTSVSRRMPSGVVSARTRPWWSATMRSE